jgi:hypothetical protein
MLNIYVDKDHCTSSLPLARSELCHLQESLHPASCTMGTGGPFPGGKARPGRDADHSPPSSAEVKNKQKLSYSPLWCLLGVAEQLYFTGEIINSPI